MRYRLSAALFFFTPALCLAQAETAANCMADPAISQPAPVIRPAYTADFAAARECIANQDGDCAEAVLENIDDDDMTDDELGILRLGLGDMESLQGSSRRSRREYGRVLRLDEVSRTLATAAIERIAIRYIEDENYDNALEELERLECGEWTPNLRYLQGRAHFGDGAFSDAQVSAQAAIVAQEAAGQQVPATWRSLSTASAQRAEQAAREDIICVNERSTNSNIPRRVCTTRAQRDAQAKATQDLQRTGGAYGGATSVDTIN